MTTTTLAYFPSPAQGVWHLGPVPIRAYAVCIIVGIIAALLIGDRRWVARGGERGVIYDIALWAVPFGLIGGRLYHVMTDWKTYFGPGGAGPVAALRIWDGGLGIWGAVALGGVGAWIACRSRGIPLPAFGDAIAPGIILAQAIGRVGNYFNQELYGRETTVPWGMQIFYRQDPSGIVDVHSLNGVSTGQVAAVVHPTFLYELLWNLLVFVVLLLIDRRFKMGHGRLFALYVALYCVGRFVVELLRDDTATHIAGIRINSFTSTFVFLGAVVYLILAKKGREDPSTLGGRHDIDEFEDEPELAPELAAEFAAVAAGTGVVAAATVAGAEDQEAADVETVADEDDADEDDAAADDAAEDFDLEDSAALDVATRDEDDDLDLLDSADESESVDEFEALDDSDASDTDDGSGTEPDAGTEDDVPEVPSADDLAGEDADDVEPDADDEAVVEAEVIAPGVEVESADEAEGRDAIDEDHDPISEEELEGLSENVVAVAPVSEQEELLEADVTDEDDSDDEDDAADEDDSDDAADAADAEADEVQAADAADSGAEPVAEPHDEAELVANAEDSAEPEDPAESVADVEDSTEPEPEDSAEPAVEVDDAPESVADTEDAPEPAAEPARPRRRALFRRRR